MYLNIALFLYIYIYIYLLGKSSYTKCINPYIEKINTNYFVFYNFFLVCAFASSSFFFISGVDKNQTYINVGSIVANR